MNHELCYLSASDAIRQFKAGTLSPVTLMAAVLEAAREGQAVINATTAIWDEDAMAAATAAEIRYKNGTARPLEGVPVAVKEETSVIGRLNTSGSLLFNEIPEHNHPIIDKLLEAGAILHIQTTVPEFCVLGQAWSKRWGVTRNPWNTAITCGGSSGGSGAALGAGMAPLATGSDMGGSIRIPAAFQGLYGFKPPFGRLAAGPGEELFAFASEGPMARTFEDVVLMQNVMAGQHPASFNGMPFTPLPSQYDDLTGWKLAVSYDLGSIAVQQEVVDNLKLAVEGLRRRGAVVDEINITWDQLNISHVLMEAIFGIYFAEFLETIPQADIPQLNTYVQTVMQKYCGKKNSIANAANLASEMHLELAERVWGQGYRALLCPTLFTTELPADLDPTITTTLPVAGKALDSYLGYAATPAFNLLHRYPVISVPTGLAGNGVPTGMQIVAQPFQDEVAFQVAYNHDQAGTSLLYKSIFPV